MACAYRRLGGVPAPAQPRSGWDLAWRLPLVALVGMGGHFSKNALAPAQPALEALGLSPVAYALLFDCPTVGAILLPTLWGRAYARARRTVLLLVPAGILAGQVALAIGLWLLLEEAPSGGAARLLGAEAALAGGALATSAFRAGGELVQHTLLADLVKVNLTRGFAFLIFATHWVVVLCNVAVPRLLKASRAAHGESWRGVLHVQCWLLVPSALSVLAASALCMWYERPASASCGGAARGVRLPGEELAEATGPGPRLGAGRSRRQCGLLLAWGGLSVGLFHALQGINSGLATSLGLSAESAGDVTARNQTIALASLPLVSFLGARVGERRLAALLSLAALAGGAVLAAATCSSLPAAAWEGALAAMAVCGVFAPVLALSLVPRVADEPGCAYGALDSLKSLTQAAATLALGELREAGGYSLALACCCGVLAAAAALAVALARGAGSPAAAPKVAHEDLCSARTCAQSCAQKTSAAALVAAGV